ncbi:uncharacterized protein [Drosophila tropicalis]|uniref:uncharacterized protein n=1 Tax=Drosophila tropicalis TaxID=46794 RepID=UPI0035ABD42B
MRRIILMDAVIFKLTNMECLSYNETWFVIHKCRLKALRRNVAAFYFNGTASEPVYDLHLHGQLFKRASGYKPFLINTDIDMCRYFRKPYNALSRTLMDLFLDFTNFNHTCPYVGDQIVDGFYLRPEMFKLPLPTGEYKLALRWYVNKKLQFDTNASFEFVENLIDQ